MPRIYHPYLRGLSGDLDIRAQEIWEPAGSVTVADEAYRYDSAKETKEGFLQRVKIASVRGLITVKAAESYIFNAFGEPARWNGSFNAFGDPEHWNGSAFEHAPRGSFHEDYLYRVSVAEREKQDKRALAKITGDKITGAESTDATTRFVNWWKCSNKTSPGLVPDSFAQIACYLRNGFMVVGGVAAWVALIYVLGRGEKN